MSNMILIIIAILSLLLSLACFYVASSLNTKLNRLRRRYDLLLRGHGEMNMEEFLISLSDELEKYKDERREVGQKLFHVEQWIAKTDTDQSAYVDSRFSSVREEIKSQMEQTSQNLVSGMKRLDEQVYARMDAVEKGNKESLDSGLGQIEKSVGSLIGALSQKLKKNEEDAFIHFDSLDKKTEENKIAINGGLQALSDEFNKKTESIHNNLSEKMSGIQTMTQNRFQILEQRTEESLADLSEKSSQADKDLNESLSQAQNQLDKALRDEMNKLDSGLREDMRKKQEETDSRITSFQHDLTADMQSLDNRISDRLSFAIQKFVLHRYNAFEDISGESSFTAVMLDEHKSGIILTVIYSRESSHSFAKEVKGGSPLQALSPEEEKAFNEAIKL